jgi:hypothetical protein
MGLLVDPEFLWTGFNLAILLYVIYDLYQELGTIFMHIARTGKREGIFVTFVHRLSSTVYSFLLLCCAGMIFIVKNSESPDAVMLIAPVALLIGFFIRSLICRICFINDSGLGSVLPNDEMEFQWEEIRSYAWKENMLCLTLRRTWLRHKKIKFSDSSAMVAVNDRLRNGVRENSTAGSGT